MSSKPIATSRSATGVPTGRLAVWWVLASEVVIFRGLLASYVIHRLGHPEWAAAAALTNTWIGAFNTFVLLSSSFTAVLAHQAAERLVDGTIELERLDNVIFVGRPAFGQEHSTVGLFKLTADGEATRVNVKLGRSSVQTIEILDGLQPGDQVILSDKSAWDAFDRVRLG